MLKVLFGLILLTLCLSAKPDWTDTYAQAKQKALDEGKYVIVMLSKEHCQACWYMENIVFKDDKVERLLMNNFIPVYIDVHTDNVPDGFDYIGTPTFYFMDAEGKSIAPRIDGARNVKEFTKQINTILKK